MSSYVLGFAGAPGTMLEDLQTCQSSLTMTAQVLGANHLTQVEMDVQCIGSKPRSMWLQTTAQ